MPYAPEISITGAKLWNLPTVKPAVLEIEMAGFSGLKAPEREEVGKGIKAYLEQEGYKVSGNPKFPIKISSPLSAGAKSETVMEIAIVCENEAALNLAEALKRKSLLKEGGIATMTVEDARRRLPAPQAGTPYRENNYMDFGALAEGIKMAAAHPERYAGESLARK